MNENEIEINGTVYAPKDSLQLAERSTDGLAYVIVRTYSASVFAGYLSRQNGKEVLLLQARRIWKWVGAASLSQLAVDGTSNPSGCKFPCEVPSVLLTEAIEIIAVTGKAKVSIDEVPLWTQ